MASDVRSVRAHYYLPVNGIRLHCLEQGEGLPVLLCHGFPELSYSWRYQMPALAEAGFRALAPDLRGYGESDKPEGIEAYDIFHLVDDLVGLLDALDIEQAVIAGHDWGGIIVWQMALLHPERVRAVISLNTPFLPRGPLPPTELFKAVPDGRFNYILHFQEPGVAEGELEPNLEGNLGRIMRGTGAGQDFLSDEDLQVFVRAFKKGGLTGPINFYRNFDRNWRMTEHLTDKQVPQPSLMITAENDPILTPAMAEGMERWVPNLRRHLVRGSGHWTQQEKPDEVSRVMIEFLNDLTP